MIVALIFVFTTMGFLLYVLLVGRRQRKAMDRIVQQDIVVSNVFPSAIRERLYQHQRQGQLRNFISTSIAGIYRENAFHNFEHASHVTASVKKLLARIVNTAEGNGLGRSRITSDPLTQFAVVFSAIIHDVDHPGVPNIQLVKENTRSAQIY